MSDPWFSTEVYKALPALIAIPGVALGVLTPFFNGTVHYDKYVSILITMSFLFALCSIIFALVAKFYGQPDSAVFDFFAAGIICIIVTTGMKHIL